MKRRGTNQLGILIAVLSGFSHIGVAIDFSAKTNPKACLPLFEKTVLNPAQPVNFKNLEKDLGPAIFIRPSEIQVEADLQEPFGPVKNWAKLSPLHKVDALRTQLAIERARDLRERSQKERRVGKKLGNWKPVPNETAKAALARLDAEDAAHAKARAERRIFDNRSLAYHMREQSLAVVETKILLQQTPDPSKRKAALAALKKDSEQMMDWALRGKTGWRKAVELLEGSQQGDFQLSASDLHARVEHLLDSLADQIATGQSRDGQPVTALLQELAEIGKINEDN